MIDTEHTEITSLNISGRASSPLSECIREAILVATTEWINVNLTYGRKTYAIKVNDLFSCAYDSDNASKDETN